MIIPPPCHRPGGRAGVVHRHGRPGHGRSELRHDTGPAEPVPNQGEQGEALLSPPMTTAHRAPTSVSAPSRPHGVLRGDIEGLRAVAVLMVLAYHVGVPGSSGGFAGVDVFFVISGYLITNQLVREAQQHGRVSLPRFYARRARRLLRPRYPPPRR